MKRSHHPFYPFPCFVCLAFSLALIVAGCGIGPGVEPPRIDDKSADTMDAGTREQGKGSAIPATGSTPILTPTSTPTAAGSSEGENAGNAVTFGEPTAIDSGVPQETADGISVQKDGCLDSSELDDAGESM